VARAGSQERNVGTDANSCRNLGILALVFAAFMAFSTTGSHSCSFGQGVDISCAVTAMLFGGYLLWCWRFLFNHLDRPTSYFRNQDARAFRVTQVAFLGVGPFFGVLAAITYLGNDKLLSGLLLAPAGFLVLCGVGRLTGGIRPL
jgi:hypothetical protein